MALKPFLCQGPDCRVEGWLVWGCECPMVGHQKMTSLKLEYFARVAGIWPLLEFRERFSTRKALVEEGRKMTCLACIPSAGRGGGAGRRGYAGRYREAPEWRGPRTGAERGTVTQMKGDYERARPDQGSPEGERGAYNLGRSGLGVVSDGPPAQHIWSPARRGYIILWRKNAVEKSGFL